ncbi:aspartate aminotransferase family protein [Bosea sp. (in: a-proteobacteria)]|jgi:adenosylmethionine-8-amino-7-oxononanoate aminotransferase|uniref:aspartate aminotransferase family protein n=1 Tax=Bosea sp. (in: a-proteobacteria) TaxID=1871050 RepID=UPI002DDDA297|nr:aspartate aminotransferase family protein [Bosea sp. (in: a-proteobacteria)]HEV2511464.1 aspartate aminotransferase family protein [Bosea sp. (in: a-proteobacteria)]
MSQPSPRASASAVLHRNLRSTPQLALAGEGVHLVDAEGRRYLDASGGAAVSCLGHGHPRVTAAIIAQLGKLEYAHTSFFTNEPSETLAQMLIERAPAGFGRGRVAFLGSGSEAMEAALKLARQYFVEIGQPERSRFISRRMSYHGNTLGALAVGGHAGRRALYQPILIETSQIAPCYAYRDQHEGETEEAYGLRVADELDAEINRLGPESVAAFIAEPIVGATLGSVTAVPGYFARIREICDRHGVLFIADEVMCGMGRAGAMFVSAQEGVRPDIITIAKGLGAGYQPIAATMASERVAGAIEAGSGLLANGHTYMSHAVACAASIAVIETIEEEGLLDNVQLMGALLSRRLNEAFGQHPHVGDIRGRGLLQSLELVADRDSKQPFPAKEGLAARIKQTAQGLGLICYPSSGTADGVNGDHVLLAPPFTIDAGHVDEIVEKLGAALAATLPVARSAA